MLGNLCIRLLHFILGMRNQWLTLSFSQNDISAFEVAGRRLNNYLCDHNRGNVRCCFDNSKTAKS